MTVYARLGSLIVLGGAEDLNFIEKLINQIDVPTQQILIEAFVVEVGSDFDKAFGTRIGQSMNNVTGDSSKSLSLGTPFYDEENKLWTVPLQDGGLSNNPISAMTGSLGMLPSASLGEIGESKKRKSLKSYSEKNTIKKLERRLIMDEDPKSPISESYRGLRTSLMYAKSDKENPTICGVFCLYFLGVLHTVSYTHLTLPTNREV